MTRIWARCSWNARLGHACSPPPPFCPTTALSKHMDPSDRRCSDCSFGFPFMGTAVSKHGDPSDRCFPDLQRAGGGGVRVVFAYNTLCLGAPAAVWHVVYFGTHAHIRRSMPGLGHEHTRCRPPHTQHVLLDYWRRRPCESIRQVSPTNVFHCESVPGMQLGRAKDVLSSIFTAYCSYLDMPHSNMKAVGTATVPL